MTLPSLETSTTQINPLDLIEELVIANDWPFQRAADDEILVEISGRWTDYRLFFVWQEEASALQFCCRLDAKVPAKTRATINDLLSALFLPRVTSVRVPFLEMGREAARSRSASREPPRPRCQPRRSRPR